MLRRRTPGSRPALTAPGAVHPATAPEPHPSAVGATPPGQPAAPALTTPGEHPPPGAGPHPGTPVGAIPPGQPAAPALVTPGAASAAGRGTASGNACRRYPAGATGSTGRSHTGSTPGAQLREPHGGAVTGGPPAGQPAHAGTPILAAPGARPPGLPARACCARPRDRCLRPRLRSNMRPGRGRRWSHPVPPAGVGIQHPPVPQAPHVVPGPGVTSPQRTPPGTAT